MRLCFITAAVAISLAAGLLWCGQGASFGREKEDPVRKKPETADERSITVFPINIKPGKGMALEFRTKIATVVELFLERADLKNVELAQSEFVPPDTDNAAEIADAFAQYVREHPIKTRYALFGQFVGTPKTGVKAIVTVVVDRSGKIVLVERDTPGIISSLVNLWPKCPMECSLFVARRVQTHWGLPNPLRAGAPEGGKMAALVDKQSTIPPKEERAAMQKRLEAMRQGLKDRHVTVYPVHIAKGTAPGCTEQLVDAINARGLFKAVAGTVDPGLKVKGSFNEQRVLWGAARSFQQFIRKNPPRSESALYVDYGICGPDVQTPPGMKGEAGFVHLILCDRSGEWVMVDFQNSHQRDFKKIKPKTCEGCNRLTVIRLVARLEE